MRIFVYEYVCAGGGDEAFAEHLRTEGAAMLSAVLQDLHRLPGVESVTLWDARTEPPRWVNAYCIQPGEEARAFQQLARAADYSLVIAPECADILATRCH